MSDNITCQICSAMSVEQNYELPLCKNCRDSLSRTPIPIWLKGFSIVLTIILLLSLSNFPSAISAGISFERGLQAEKDGNFNLAVQWYLKTYERYPDSTLVLARLTISFFHAGKIIEAIKYLDKLSGRKAPKELVGEINDIILKINKQLESQIKEVPQ